MKRQILSALLAVMLVSSAFGPVGVASANHECDFGDSASLALINSLDQDYTEQDCTLFHGEEEVDPAEYEEAKQVHSELFSQSISQAEQAEVLNTTFENYLQDTATAARIEGKNSVVTSLSNDSTQGDTVMASEEAVNDYYAKKQVNLARSYASQARSVERMYSTIQSEENLSYGNVFELAWDLNDPDIVDDHSPNTLTLTNESVMLVNGSTIEVPKITGDTGNSRTFSVSVNESSYTEGPYVAFRVYPSDATTSTPPSETNHILNKTDYQHTWHDIKQEADEVRANVSLFAEQAYQNWDSGAINTTDLVDPYLGAREMAPNSSQSWAMRTLTGMGVTPPDNVSSLDRMEIVDVPNAQTVEGVLMAQADPADASGYEIGKTYDASQIDGHVFVATDDGAHELEGEFKIEAASRLDGSDYEAGEVIGYDRPDYQTADLSEFKNMSQQMMEMREEWETREQEIEEQAAVAPSGSESDPLLVIIALLGALAAGAGYMYQQKSEELDRMVNRR